MKFEGIYTPAITPLAADGSIDKAAFAEVLDYLVESKIHGVIIGGSTGEYYAHTAQERFELAAQAKDVLNGRLPLMIDPSGVFCRPEGRYFLSGAAPLEDPAVDWDDFEPRWEEFEDAIWPALANRSPQFEAIKLINQWAGHYDFNTLDHNLIVGRHPEVTNFIFANGFSGHGLQQGPAAGRGVSELITYGSYRTLDLTEVGYERIVENRPFLEKAVI